MELRKRRFQDCDGGGSTKVLIDDPSFMSNPQRTHGIWALFVTAEMRDEVIKGILREVESGIFNSVWFEETPVSSGDSESYVLVMEEGYVTRRILKARLESFERMGLDRGWIYCDTGVERHKSARRTLCGKGPQDLVTEIDYRKGGDEPIIREAHLPRG